MVIAKSVSPDNRVPVRIFRLDPAGNPLAIDPQDDSLDIRIDDGESNVKLVIDNDPEAPKEALLFLEDGTKGEQLLLSGEFKLDEAVLSGGIAITYVDGGDDKLQIVLV